MDLINLALAILPNPPSGTPGELAADGITFFSTWIARIGGIVAFIGAIKFALSIKNEDAREQLQSILIMVSGFMIVSAVRSLDIFNFPAVYSEYAANAEFESILDFIGKWVRRVGGLALLLGAIMFGLSIKDNNANSKVSSLKTIASGAITMAVSFILPTFAYM